MCLTKYLLRKSQLLKVSFLINEYLGNFVKESKSHQHSKIHDTEEDIFHLTRKERDLPSEQK